jgi:hypothetical protein
MRKGIVLTIDAVIALVATSSLTTVMYFNLSKTQQIQWTDSDINDVCLESLAALELNDDLKYAIDSNSTSIIESFLDNLLPAHICGKIEIYDSGNSLKLSQTKANCTSGNETSIARRTFVSNSAVYYAKMEAWFE